MTAELQVFDCEPRRRSGTGGSRAVRRDGWLPAVLYGGDQPPQNVKLLYKQIWKAWQAGRFIDVLAHIKMGDTELKVIGRDIQLDPVKDFPIHVDLLRVSDKTRLTVKVPMRFINEEACTGLKRGGVLNIVRHEVEVMALATAIPEALIADLTGLDVGTAIHISAVTLPPGVTPTITDRDFTVATIAAPSGLTSSENAAAKAE